METSFPSYSYIANLLLLSFLIFAIMLPKGMYTLRMQCNDKDRHLLLNFKHTLVDPSAILSNWTDERDCCEWTGVQCDNTTGRVIELSLPCYPGSSPGGCDDEKSNCLTGDLSLSFLRLEFLSHLNLSNNDFQALIQKGYEDVMRNCSDMSHLCENSSNLHHLDLSYNENLRVDNIHWLSRVSSLNYLSLSSIDFQKEIDWLQLATLLPSLTELHLDSCFLKNINPSLPFVNFTSLKVLSLYKNAFSTFLPHWLFNLSDLTYVDLGYNFFEGQLPKSLLNLQKIKRLSLSGNKLSGLIPDWLGLLEHLETLLFGRNLFSGPIPSTLGNLSSLTFLDVSSNYLNGSLPESLVQLLNLETLFFSDNQLTGYLTERNFVNLSNLKYLSMGSPGLNVDFYSLWVPPFQLKALHLSNMMGPKLPPWLYTQTSLKHIEIFHSTISFESKDKFWDFATQLEILNIHDSWIYGNMSNVLLNNRMITLDSNKFKSGLPRLSPNVVFFNATNNSFQGSLYPLLCQKMNERSQLRYIDLSNNFLHGGLTDCWMNWKSLVIVRLSNNGLTGTIPPSLGFLPNLTILQLSKNSLSGEMPLSLKNCHNLQILDLEENKLSGPIPNWIGHNVKVLLLRSNQLGGTIPLQICQLASLTILDLAENKISGSIPICLHNMTAMAFPSSSSRMPSFCMAVLDVILGFKDEACVMLHTKRQVLIYQKNLKWMYGIDLSSNNMSGTIPPELFSLTKLRFLNLSHNQFGGNIPKEIGDLKQLESLDLSSNQLSGEIPLSMAQLTFLGTLNLSFNNFSGMIPSGTQLQGFDAQSYMGNLELCGPPLPKNCTNKEGSEPIEGNNCQDDEFFASFYIGLGVGFAIAFWGVCAAIFFNRNFGHSYYRFLYHIGDKLMS